MDVGKTPYGRKKLEDGKHAVKHRLVMEAHLGRKLNNDEVVHHINGDTRDNRIDNLYLCKDRAEHNRLHAGDWCPHGHPFTEENTYLRMLSTGGTSRRCRECHRLEERERRMKKKEGE